MSLSISSFRAYAGFILTIIVAMAVIAALYLAFFVAGSGTFLEREREAAWSAYHVNAKLALARREKSPSLLIVGGSATFFGFSAEELSVAVGVPSLNLGVHAGNGLKYMLYVAERAAEPGDLVLLPIEYARYDKTNISKQSAQTSYMLGTDYFGNLSVGDKIEYLRLIDLRDFHEGVTGKFKPPFKPPTNRYWAFPMTDWGDMPPLHSNRQSKSKLAQNIKQQRTRLARGLAPPPDSTTQLISRFLHRMDEKGVQVYFTQPPQISVAPNTPHELARIRSALSDAGATFLELENRNRIPKTKMYDTIYHPNAAGRSISTARLAAALCKARPQINLPNCK